MRVLTGWFLMSLSIVAQGLTKMDLTCRANEPSPVAIVIEPALKPADPADRGVSIHILVRNVSDDDEPIEESDPFFLYWVQIGDPQGHKAAMRQNYKDLFFPPPHSVIVGNSAIHSVAPREVIEDVWKISDYLDLSRPGKYTVTLVRHFYQQSVTVCSNTINLYVK